MQQTVTHTLELVIDMRALDLVLQRLKCILGMGNTTYPLESGRILKPAARFDTITAKQRQRLQALSVCLSLTLGVQCVCIAFPGTFCITISFDVFS